MLNGKKYVLFTIICTQIILIILLSNKILNNKNIFKKTIININPIDKNFVVQEKSSDLKYFWDLIPNSVETWHPFFDKNTTIVNKINSDGMNDTKNYNINKDKNTFRIIALGDSFTYGHIVQTDQNWTEQLENKLNERKKCKNINKFEVLNLGVHGYDPQYEVEKYKKTGEKYNPDLIIWMLVEENRVNEIRIPIEEECTKNNPNTPVSKKYLCWEKEIEKIRKEKGVDFFNEIQKNNISKIKNLYTGPVLFIDFYGTHSRIIDEFKNSKIISNIEKLLYKQGNKFDEIHLPDQHPTVLGHKLISNIIFDELFKTNQIPCESLD